MNSKFTLLKRCRNLLVPALFLLTLSFYNGYSQNCTTPPNNLVNGNFELPTSSLNMTGTNSINNGIINNNMPGWMVSHGSPSTGSLSPRAMWLWSYSGNGEGVFNCYNFQAGQSYLICFDLQTNGKTDGATVDVRATSGLSSSTSGNGYPAVTSDLIWQDWVANYTYNNYTQISVLYTPTNNYSQLWFHPMMVSGPNGTPAPQGNPGQSEMRFDNVSVTLVDADGNCPCDLTAGFGFSDSSCTVDFTDASFGNCCTQILGYRWDFGDGTTSTSQNPSHTYPATGTYTACLTIVGLNDDGDCCTDSICLPVTVDCEPCSCEVFPDFSFESKGCSIQFNDQSTGNDCSTITQWDWDFGDGNTSTSQNPNHTYAASGSYTVCLTVSVIDVDGTVLCSDKICYKVIVDCDCVCDITADFRYQEVDPCRVSFGDLTIFSECTEITNWFWDFGDGNTSTSQNPTHTYAGPGGYSVCLTVFGNDGEKECENTICLEVIVKCDPDSKFKSTPGDLPIDLKIYPNPTAGTVFIEFDNADLLSVKVDILNSNGQLVKELASGNESQDKYALKWSPSEEGLSSGAYFVRITTGDKVKFESIIFE